MINVLRGGVIAFFIYLIYISRLGTSLFSIHPFCMALAYGVMMTEAVLAFSPVSLWKGKTPRSKLIENHKLINIVSVLAAVTGFIAIYWNKNRKGLEHFVTYHGIFGLIGILYSLMQLAAGFLKNNTLIRKKLSYKTLNRLHALSGLVGYFLGLIPLILSLSSNWFVNNSHAYSDIIIVLIYVPLAFYVAYSVLQNVKKA